MSATCRITHASGITTGDCDHCRHANTELTLIDGRWLCAACEEAGEEAEAMMYCAECGVPLEGPPPVDGAGNLSPRMCDACKLPNLSKLQADRNIGETEVEVVA